MKRNSFIFGLPAVLLVFGLVLAGCNKRYVIGDRGPGGGVIFYVSEGNAGFQSNGKTCHYLEAAPADIEGEFTWATNEFTKTSIPAAKQTEIGMGAANTAAILAVDSNAPAAKACADYRGGGKNDWFLPSKDEWREMRAKAKTIGGLRDSTPYGPAYWSSTECYDGTAYPKESDPFLVKKGTKYLPGWVRPVRAF
jgi:hypothetical protein